MIDCGFPVGDVGWLFGWVALLLSLLCVMVWAGLDV